MSGRRGRGRRARPEGLRVLDGTHREDRHGSEHEARRRAAAARAAAPLRPPKWLSPGARRVWRLVESELRAAGVLEPVDVFALAAFSVAIERLREAQELVGAEGLLVDGAKGGRVRHPAIAIVNTAAASARAWALELGLTPSARAGLPKRKPEGRSQLQEFIQKYATAKQVGSGPADDA